MKHLRRLSLIVSLVFASSLARAEQPHKNERIYCEREGNRVMLDYNELYLLGSYYLNVRSEVEQSCDISTEGVALQKVVIIAKSRFGTGFASLLAGRYQSYTQRIHGDPLDFYSPRGYDRLDFRVPHGDIRGSWNLWVRGELKVARVYLTLDLE